MQGVVFTPENPQQGSPPPSNVIVTDMEESLETNHITKQSVNQSNRSDSGIFSATSNTTIDPSTNCDSDNQSDCSSPGHKYVCPICDEMLTSQHNFTLHIRSHNNETEDQDNEKGFTCKICHKVLSSSSSLDRHVLVHSGERPFHCKYCGDTFTTNGNMHRHMRTHSAKADYESDGSTDSSSGKSIEYNNNKIDSRHSNKRKLENIEEEHNKKREYTKESEPISQSFKCPVCERSDFNSIINLETHLEDNHPEYPAKCNQCNQIFSNNKQLTLHKSMEHETNTPKQSVIGFKDLTFVDFSSEKFPHIARRECEINLHKAAGALKFQCRKCSKAFPCSSSLEIHEKNCMDPPSGLNLSKNNRVSEDEIRRTEFFSRLNLQDNSPEKKIPFVRESTNKLREQLSRIDNTKDLADIQSILSNINMQQLQSKHNELKIVPPKSVIDINDSSKNEQEEESQDSFVLEFRKMKLRGEFPCRLCTAVFPNLRALKGHNRAHLNGNTNGTYYCNMCPHSSIDKAALIRHMRTHNGDRPYECSLCNYAFTTKANCERHLRNRHSKTTRDEVKKSIIYHPSEDPTNEDLNKLTLKDESKKHGPGSPVEPRDLTPEKVHCSTPKIPTTIKTDLSFPMPDLQALKPTKIFSNIDFLRNENIKNLKEQRFLNGISPFFHQPFNLTTKLSGVISQPENIPTKIQVKPFDILKDNNNSFDNQSENEYYEEEDEQPPMDVALDLSKKKTDEDKKRLEEDSPQDLTKKIVTSPVVPRTISTVNELFAQQLLKSPPKIDPTALYATHLANLCRNGFPGWPGFPVNPLFFQALPTLPRTPQDLKERTQRYQFCGGSIITEELKNFQHLQPQQSLPQQPQALLSPITAFNPKPELKQETSNFPQNTSKSIEETKPLSLNIETNFNDNASTMHSPAQQLKSDLIQSPNSVKMVIKNGVLMPKQKQRRYRTERPFTCEHCSARFTLRSNMERHIKQQHPQFWSQRQRSNVGQPGRKPQGMISKPNFCDLPLPNYEIQKMHDFDRKEHLNEKLKFALLAQQLRAGHVPQDVKKEDDEDCDLVIDENDKAEEHDTQKMEYSKNQILEEKLKEFQDKIKSEKNVKSEEDLVPVSRLLDNASQQQFQEFFKREGDDHEIDMGSEEDEEGVMASGSTTEENISGTDENRSESETVTNAAPVKKKSAYSLAPNRVSCPYCSRKFPWTSSLRRHVLTHTGQKPFRCRYCPLVFTTKSNCDRHMQRKHGNVAATVVTTEASNNNGVNYLIRNVPERPFKCSSCPSSTFSTYSNLKKHISCKHSTNAQGDDIKAQGYEAGSSEDEKINQIEGKNDWENQIAYSRFPAANNLELHSNSQVSNTDLPFKCHLCEGSFGERNEALDHIRDKHVSEYDLLMSKNALDTNATTPDEAPHHDDEDNDIRGKFPDYSNRKVICAWCMRRFWSAEDLRRHMRTHTGERPFSCDICRRRFTLKHSMLRHRKKHAINSNFEQDTTHSDEDGSSNVSPSLEPFVRGDKEESAHKRGDKTDESDAHEGGGDLISNLLGIQDRTIIDKVLDASADDAAKLLGVRNGAKE